MGYYDEEKTAREYIAMADGYDGTDLIASMAGYVPDGARVLEIGMGPGKDLDILTRNYRATGSDSSQFFVELYRQAHPDADLLILDAVTLDTGRKFDCVYSNKVLNHLNANELRQSFQRQFQLLNHGGYVLHSFWKGEGADEFAGLKSFYRSQAQIILSVTDLFDVTCIETYGEMESDDSIYVLAQLTPP